MAGAKLVGVSPTNAEYLRKHAERRVFKLGDNVVISTGAILIGPLTICDNVIIGPMALVTKSISEPGVYVGAPARRISDKITEEWVTHLSKGPGNKVS
jgi:serine acetyltransferase